MKSIEEIKVAMDKTINSLEHEFDKIRTGRANPAMLDGIEVEAYGNPSPINQVAMVSIPEAKQLLIKPYDPSMLKGIEDAINKSNLGINPTNDGTAIRLLIPALTEESRRELTKISKQKAEEVKIQVRNVRKEANNNIKKDADFSEDEKKRLEEQVQELTNQYNKQIDERLKIKDQEIMKI